MKQLIFLIVLFLAITGSAPAETIQLFDGKKVSNWIIEGEHRIEDGVLIVGGTKATRLRIDADLSGEWTLVLEEKHTGSTGYDLHMSRFMGGKGSRGSSGSGILSNEWHEMTYRVAEVANQMEFSEFRSGEKRVDSFPIRGTITSFYMTVAANSTMEIRSASLTYEPPSLSRKWLVPAILLFSFLVILVLAFALWRRMRRWNELDHQPLNAGIADARK